MDLSLTTYSFLFHQVLSASNIVKMFLVLSLFFTSIGGLIVASILKNLDNVVKVVENKVEFEL